MPMNNYNEEPLVSVIIPTYNSAQFIPNSVSSVASQTYPNIEILIIDDGSTDDTEIVVQALPGSIRYIKQINSGPSSARNRGIAQSKGKYIAFLDVDDEWEPSKIENQVALFENDKSLSIVAASYVRCDADLSPVETICLEIPSKNKGVVPFRMLLEKNQLLTSSIMLRKQTLDVCGFFDEKIRFGEDWDLWVRAAQLGGIGYLQTPLAKYRAHGGGLTGKLDDKNMQDWLEVIRKNKLRADNWYDKNITYRKSLSWYLYNYSYLERVRGRGGESKKKGIKAAIVWPFSIRTLRIIKGLFVRSL